MKSLLILCLLGDPMLPAASCDRSGGFNVDSKELIEFLSSKDYQCMVITNLSEECNTAYERINDNILLCRISLDGADQNCQEELFQRTTLLYQQIEKIIKQYNFHPSLIHSYYWLSGYLARQLAETLSVPFVHSIVALSIDKEKAGARSNFQTQMLCEKAFLSHANAIFAITDSEKETVCERYAIPADRLVVVGREVPDIYLHPAHDELGIAGQLPSDIPLHCCHDPSEDTAWWTGGVFTYVGRLKEEKGVPSIISAWLLLYSKYADLTPPLWLVGGDIEAIEKLRAALPIDHSALERHEKAMRICWWGHLDAATISGLYLKTLAFIAHSQYEAGGRVIIEAMSHSKPVIATPVGFARDLIQDWFNGFLVDFGDVSALSERMEYFIRQPLLSCTLGAAAKDSFLRANDRWDCYRRIAETYATVLGQQVAVYSPVDEHYEGIDYFSLGLLCTYPYHYKRYIDTERNLYLPHPHLETTLPSAILRAFLSETEAPSGKEISIYYYDELNKMALWNDDCEEAILAETRFQKALYSCQSNVVLSAVGNDANLHCVIVRYKETLSCLHCGGKALLDLIKAFHNGWERPLSVEKDWLVPPLEQRVRELLGRAKTSNWQNASEVEQVFKELSWRIKPLDQGINYGASLMGRIAVSADGAYQLLPSSELCYCELGDDIGRCLYDCWKSGVASFQETTNLIGYVAEQYGVGVQEIEDRMILYAMEQLCISWAMNLHAQSVETYADLFTLWEKFSTL